MTKQHFSKSIKSKHKLLPKRLIFTARRAFLSTGHTEEEAAMLADIYIDSIAQYVFVSKQIKFVALCLSLMLLLAIIALAGVTLLSLNEDNVLINKYCNLNKQ